MSAGYEIVGDGTKWRWNLRCALMVTFLIGLALVPFGARIPKSIDIEHEKNLCVIKHDCTNGSKMHGYQHQVK